ncbi:hypothetical protein WA158_004491 [Blastocystis sp. Blastoise]
MKIFDIVKTFTDEEASRLFSSVGIPASIVQMLPNIQQQIIFFLCQCTQTVNITLSFVKSYIKVKEDDKMMDDVQDLVDYHILRITDINGNICTNITSISVGNYGSYLVFMNDSFKTILRKSLGTGERYIYEEKKNYSRNNEHDIEGHSILCWKRIMAFILGDNSYISDILYALLLSAGIVKNEKNQLDITSFGYEFLLMSSKEQCWILINQIYMHCLSSLPPDPSRGNAPAVLHSIQIELLSFLLTLGQLAYNIEYSMDKLTDIQRLALPAFNNIGVIFIPNGKEVYCVTKLGLDLCNDKKNNLSYNPLLSEESGLEIVIETNFKIYVYTSNVLYISLLQLFVEIHTILPNLACGQITRQNMREAFKCGITANQICQFLTEYSRPEKKEGGKMVKCIPDNIVDQIFLWEQENNRIDPAAGLLLTDFKSTNDYQDTLEYMKDNKMLLWSNENTDANMMVIKPKGFELLQQKEKRR